MDRKTLAYSIVGVTVVAAIVAIIVVSSKPKKHVRQNWGTNQIGMGAFPPSVDPGAMGPGTVWTYAAKTAADKTDTKALLQKWYQFADAIGPQLAGAIYALFPDLQTKQSISYYGLSAGMARTLKSISLNLGSPEGIKTVDDVMRVFGRQAAGIFNEELQMKPEDGKYLDQKGYGDFIDVY